MPKKSGSIKVAMAPRPPRKKNPKTPKKGTKKPFKA